MAHLQESAMGLVRRILMMFGRQYVMLRFSNAQSFRIAHAYPIAGHWYVKSKERGTHFMLGNATRVTDLKPEFDPTTMVSTSQLWIPVTDRVDAGVRMYE